MSKIDSVRRKSKRLYAELNNWRKVGPELDITGNGEVTGGMAWRLANEPGYEPTDPHKRFILGLPALVPTPACEKCGQVHVRRYCTNGNHAKATPRRVAIRVDDMPSAAGTILRNVEPGKVKELIRILENELTLPR